MTLTPCKAHMRRCDAMRDQNALAFHAKILWFEAGLSVACTALAVGNQLVKNIRTIGMGCGLSIWKRFVGWFRLAVSRVVTIDNCAQRRFIFVPSIPVPAKKPTLSTKKTTMPFLMEVVDSFFIMPKSAIMTVGPTPTSHPSELCT